MIIKGNPAGNVKFWAEHLQRDDTNERAEIKEVRGLISDDLRDALLEMRGLAAGSRSQGNFMYQANINPEAHEHLTEAQWKEAFDTLEKNLGLENHQRVIVEHEKNGRVHRHAVWNRVDADDLRVADMGGNWKTHERTARELEIRFELTPMPTPEPDRPPPLNLWEIRAAERTGIKPEALKAELTTLWQQSDTGAAFKEAIEDRGYLLAKGDSRDFCVIDQAGTAHSLARRLDGVKTADMRQRMGDVDRDSLPSVAEARAAVREANHMQRVEERQKAREPTPTEQKISQHLADPRSAADLAGALHRDGLTIARVDEKGIAQLAHEAHDKTRLNPEAKPYQPKIKEGELVAVGRAGGVHTLNPYRLDLDKLERGLTTGDQAIAPLSHVRDVLATERQEKQAGRDADVQSQWRDRKDAQVAARIDPAPQPVQKAGKAALMVAETATSPVQTLMGFLGGLGGSARPQTRDQLEQFEAQRRTTAALENLSHSLARGERLSPSDIQNLTPTQIENLKLRGDDYMRQLVSSFEKERKRERENDWGRDRER